MQKTLSQKRIFDTTDIPVSAVWDCIHNATESDCNCMHFYEHGKYCRACGLEPDIALQDHDD